MFTHKNYLSWYNRCIPQVFKVFSYKKLVLHLMRNPMKYSAFFAPRVWLCLLSSLLFVVGISSSSVIQAAPGNLVATVTVPVPARVGVSVGFDGKYLYYTNYESTLLYKMTIRGSLVESFDVGQQLGALSWDAGRQRFWAGTLDESGRIFLADPNNGAVTEQFSVGGGFHDGLAYDASDDTLWFSNDASTEVRHYTTSGELLNTYTVPFGNSGIAVGGPTLYMGSADRGIIYKVDKLTFTVLGSFASPGGRDEDIECDNVSFAPREVIWSKDAYNNTLTAFEVTPGTCQVGLVQSPQGQLQLHMPEALPAGSFLAPVVSVFNNKPSPANYTVKVELFKGDTLRSTAMRTVNFAWQGKQELTFDFGTFAPGDFRVVATLFLDGQLIAIEQRYVGLGTGYLGLRMASASLTEAAYAELNDGRDIAAQALAGATGSATGETVDFLSGELVGRLADGSKEFTKLNNLSPGLKDFAKELIDKRVATMLNIGKIVKDGAKDASEPLWKNFLDNQSYNAYNQQVYNADADVSSYAFGKTFAWNTTVQTESERRIAAIKNKNETVGVVGLTIDAKTPFVRTTSLVEQKGQFDWLNNNLGEIIEGFAIVVLVLFLLAGIITVVAVSLASVFPPALAAIALSIAKLALVAGPFLGKLYGLLKFGKFILGFCIVTMVAMSISTGATEIVAPKVVEEHKSAMDYLRSTADGQLQRVAVQSVAKASGYEVRASTQATGISDAALATQIYRADGQILDIVDHQGAAETTWRLPSGRYWTVGVAQGAKGVTAQRSTIDVTGAQVTLDMQLKSSQVLLDSPIEATITLKNENTITSTGDLVLGVMTLRGEALQFWTPNLGPGAMVSYTYSFAAQAEGGDVLRASVGNDFGPVATVDRPFVVGVGSALALNIVNLKTYQPDDNITLTANVLSAGTVPTTTIVVRTYDRNHGYQQVYTETQTLSMDAGTTEIVPLLVLPTAAVGAYSTMIDVGGQLYSIEDFIVEAEGSLFATVQATPEVATIGSEMQLSVEVQNELYAPTDAEVSLLLTTPLGEQLTLPITADGAGRYRASYVPTVSGTFTIVLNATKPNYLAANARSAVVVDVPSQLYMGLQGELIIRETQPLTVSVYNEQFVPVSEATVVVSSTDGLVTATTNSQGIAVLFSTPTTLTPVLLRVEAPGFAPTTTHVPVKVVPNLVGPEVSLFIPALTNKPSLELSGLTEVGASITVNDVAATTSESGMFDVTLPLVEGENTIVVTASSSTGSTTTFTQTVILDTVLPSLQIISPVDGGVAPSGTVLVTGSTEPDAVVMVNNQAVSPNISGMFQARAAVPQQGRTTIAIRAIDAAGNESLATRSVSREHLVFIPLASVP